MRPAPAVTAIAAAAIGTAAAPTQRGDQSGPLIRAKNGRAQPFCASLSQKRLLIGRSSYDESSVFSMD